MSIVSTVALGRVTHEPNEDKPKSLSRPIVLCVDDDHKQLAMRVAVLSAAGYSVVSTTSSSEALRLCATGGVDVLVSDFDMPGLNGAALANAVRDLVPIPIVLYSGHVDLPPHVRETADVFISKGEPPQALLAAVERLLEGTVRRQ
jgi:two-component system C4-dicarboxylate transport response regulator DctD